jgi:hypothetical protein
MKGILIVLLTTILLAIIDFAATAAVAKQMAPAPTGISDALSGLSARQSEATTGGGIGGAVGLLGGSLIAMQLDKKKKPGA